MVHKLRWPATMKPLLRKRVAATMTMALLCCLGLAPFAGPSSRTFTIWHQGVMPPGAIGSRQLQRGGPLPGFFQPVEIKAPPGALISLASGDQFGRAAGGALPRGHAHRLRLPLRVTNIPLPEGGEGLEVFPSIEVIDRLYAPLGRNAASPFPSS